MIEDGRNSRQNSWWFISCMGYNNLYNSFNISQENWKDNKGSYRWYNKFLQGKSGGYKQW